MRDLHSKLKAMRAIAPIALGTTGTGQVGKIIDRQGYDSLEYVIDYGTLTGVTAKVTPVLKECDTTGGSFTSVADADMLGTELGAALTSGTRTSGTTKNVSKQLGYIGNKRYTQLSLINTVTAGIVAGATAILGSPQAAPVN